MRLRRSCLVSPGSNLRMLEKAAASDADEVVLDLEDAVLAREKETARGIVASALQSVDFGEKLVAVRVNAVQTPLCVDDLVEVVSRGGARIDCVVLPKVEHVSHVHFVADLLAGLEDGADRARPIGIEVLVESATGAVYLREISAASDRIEALLFGPGDYAASLGVPQLEIGAVDPRHPDQWNWVMSAIAAHARATGAAAVDGPYADFRDQTGFVESARRASALGFEGKWCIHPDQVAWANEAFTPTTEQLEAAEMILSTLRASAERGDGSAELNGRMIDEASARMAESITARARAAGL